jgi:hypothetical protein
MADEAFSVDDIRPLPPPTDHDLATARQEQRKTFPSKSELERDRYQQETGRRKAEHWLRIIIASVTFLLVLSWLATVLVVLFLQGLGKLSLSDTVLVTLLATTTFNVVGLFLAVNQYLFPKMTRVLRKVRKHPGNHR